MLQHIVKNCEGAAPTPPPATAPWWYQYAHVQAASKTNTHSPLLTTHNLYFLGQRLLKRSFEDKDS